MIVGLTGGICSGKSTVSNIFRELNLEIYDGDIIAKEIMKKKDTLDEIKEKLGKDIFTYEGELNRIKLKELVFGNKEKLNILNGIVHPKVKEEYKKIRNKIPKSKVVIFDVPLLFETNLDVYCDITLVVDVKEDIQIKRIVDRDGITSEMGEKIISNQMKREEKLRKADYIIENNGTLCELKEKTLRFYEKLKKEER
ncbi:MAG: dephospho-CoA kinase [Cetobacterium sp.]|nr:dephospho-CoA kinase [Cetobacterium sp.]